MFQITDNDLAERQNEPPSMAERTRFNWSAILDGLAAVMVIGASGAIVWNVFAGQPGPRSVRDAAVARKPPTPTEPLTITDAPRKGDVNAKVVVVEFADFQCPACVKFAREIWPGVVENYLKPGKVSFAFRHFPLPQHKFAKRAADAAICAGQQSRFWEMYEAQFAAAALNEDTLGRLALSVGLDAPRFRTCLSTDVGKQVAADVDAARKLGIMSTPTFLVGTLGADGRVTVVSAASGAGSRESFFKVLDDTLKKVKP